MSYSKGFDFDSGNLDRNLAMLDNRIHDFISEDIELHARQAEVSMKIGAPWRNRTWNARRGLWANAPVKGPDTYRIEMGHTVDYGIYLEEHNQKRFAIIVPTMIATAKSFMSSLERMFAQLEARVPPVVHINPQVTTKPNTTRTEFDRRDARGRFVDQGKGYSKAAKAAKALAKRIADRNALRRQRYAQRKADGTLPTRKTKRG